MRASRLPLSIVSVVAVAAPAFAADVAKPTAPVATPLETVAPWSGLHIGLNAGIGGGKVDYPVTATAGTLGVAGAGSMRGAGALLGAQIGWDHLYSNRLLLGLEADFGWSNLEDALSLAGSASVGGVPIGSASGAVGSRLEYLGTVRARVGYAVTDPWLVYLTGGWAHGSVKSFYSAGIAGGPGIAGDVTKQMSGWAAGLGTEYAITPDLSFRAEYLHVDLGSAGIAGGTIGPVTAALRVAPSYDFVRAGINYRFGATASRTAVAPAAYTAPRSFDWTGFHVGLNGGYGKGANDYPIDATALGFAVTGKAGLDASGFLAGAQIGYDHKVTDRILLGLEADFDWADLNGRLGLAGAATNGGVPIGTAAAAIGSRLDYVGTVRGRIGWTVTDPWLIYATGGWAWGGSTSSAGIDIPGVFTGGVSKKLTHNGWAAGLGTEFAVARNLTVRAEYLHVDFGSGTLLTAAIGGAAGRLRFDPSYDLVRVGVNYKFDFGNPGPVVAKY